MADASSAFTSTAAQLREAAKQTMRRKQAPSLRPPNPPTRNGTNLSSSNKPSLAPSSSSATSSPVKLPPKGPRGVPSFSATNAGPLNYGDANDSSTAEASTVSAGAGPAGASGKSEPRRISATRARVSAGKGEDGPEEGEISDEETRVKRCEQGRTELLDKPPVVPAAPQLPPAPAENLGSNLMTPQANDGVSPNIPTSGPIEQTNDGDTDAKATTSKRTNTSGGMPPPRPPMNVHREPAPISPTASIPVTQAQPTGRTLAEMGKLGDEPAHDIPRKPFQSVSSVETPPPQTPPTLSMNKGPARSGYNDDMCYQRHQDEEEEGETSELSPKTAQMNQDVFSHLLQLGVDDNHCRPGLPMTFQQFNAAKELILDLLGYGMTPENIADIGVNRRLLVYCLRELKIRLPANVPVDDIVMFDPPFEPTIERSKEDSEASSRQSTPNDDLQSPTSMEITPVDGLIVETVSESSSTSPSPPPPPPPPPTRSDTLLSKSPSPPRHSLPPAPKLNVHAEPFLPAKPPPQTTGPSLFAMALPHQQIAPLPSREPPTILPAPPPSLPRRPVLSYDAVSSRRSTAGSSSAATVVAFSAPTGMDTEMEPPSHEAELLQKLEQEKKLLLLSKLQSRKKGALTLSMSDRPSSAPPQAPPAKATPDADSQHRPSILGGERVGSPSPMDLDTPVSQTLAAPNMPTPVAVPLPNLVVMPKRPPVQLRATLARAMTSAESTRPSTPLEGGPKRGVKRPKADDFVEDNQPAKKSARLNGLPNMPPLKRSSFAIANSTPQEQLVFTWVDDENVETIHPNPWNQSKDPSVNGAKDSEAAQLAAAAMAIGLPMTAEELEIARIQEEERKAQLNAKAAKLLQTQANLKRLELKKAEKKLLILQSVEDQSAISGQVLAVQNTVQTLKQELETIEAKLPSTQPTAAIKVEVKETPSTENPSEMATPEPVTQLEVSALHKHHAAGAALLELSTHLAAASTPSVVENEDWDMLKDDGENRPASLLLLDLISSQTLKS